MTVNSEISGIARNIKEEINKDIELSIGSVEHPAQAVPVLVERMDKICAMMDFQAEIISHAESDQEEKRYLFEKKKLIAKKKYNTAFVTLKQDDRPKPKCQRRTDKEYEALADLEADIEMNESLTAEKEYWKSNHRLMDEKHKYEILNNHFLSYRKACDMIVKEMDKLGGPRERYGGTEGVI